MDPEQQQTTISALLVIYLVSAIIEEGKRLENRGKKEKRNQFELHKHAPIGFA